MHATGHEIEVSQCGRRNTDLKRLASFSHGFEHEIP